LPNTPIGIRRDRGGMAGYRFLPRWEGGRLRLALPLASHVKLEVLDVRGRPVAIAYEGPGDGRTLDVPLRNLQAGLRILRLEADRRVMVDRAVIW
jgi:hypothetical protein